MVEYLYNDTGNVYKVTHTKSGISELYYYTANGELKSSLNSQGDSARYIYDNLKNLQKLSYTVGGKTRSFKYLYDSGLTNSRDSYLRNLTKAFNDESVLAHLSVKGVNGMKSLYNTYYREIDEDISRQVIKFNNKYHFIHYDLSTCMGNIKQNKNSLYNEWHECLKNYKTFYLWLKPTGYFSQENLLTFQEITSSEDNLFENINTISHLSVDGNGKIGYRTNSFITRTSGSLNINAWNLVGIKFVKKDENEDENKSSVQLILNGEVTEEVEISHEIDKFTHFAVGLQTDLNTNVLTSSSAFTSGSENNLNMPFAFCFLSVGAYNYPTSLYTEIYENGMNYLTKFPDNGCDGVSYRDERKYDDFDVVSFNKSLTSKNGIYPNSNVATMPYYNNAGGLFKFDESLQKYVYHSTLIDNGEAVQSTPLEYNLGLTTQGTISLWFKLDNDVQSEYRGIIGHKAPTSDTEVFYEKLGLYSYNGKLRLKLDGTTFCSALESSETINCNDNKWHNVVLTYKNSETVVYYDGYEWIKYQNSVNLNGLNTQIGSVCLTGLDNTKTQLEGCLSDLNFKNQYMEPEEVAELFKTDISIINVNDPQKRRKRTVFSSGDNSFEINYTYDKMRVTKETDFKGNTIEYTYDNMGNIATKTIDKNELGSFSDTYTYDSWGRLTGVNFANGSGESYTYDTNGNILTYSYNNGYTKRFFYDNVNKDILTKVQSVNNMDVVTFENTIEYHPNNKFLPVSMIINGTSQNLTWEGKRLIGVGNTTYAYDGTGRRTSKTVNGVTTNFKYVGNNLVKMVTGDSELEFVYDANGVLVGVNTASGNYFYHRDITGNILGIVDKLGNYMIEYTYNVWGKVSKTVYNTCTDTALALNPFVFKGYFYDEETGFYYLKSRYYNPDICRFISMDDIDYLDETSISGVNLYAYCNNNPVMYADPSGHFAITTFLIGLAASWVISSIASYYLGEHLVSGASSVYGGVQTITTGISLLSYGPVGWVLGGSAIVLGAVNIAFGTAELQQHFTGNNWINDIGITGGLYTGLYIGSSIASAAVSIGGTAYMNSSAGKLAYEIQQNAKHWNKGTFKTKFGTLKYHLKAHGRGLSPTEYTNRALSFYDYYQSLLRPNYSDKYNMVRYIHKNKIGVGYYDELGYIIDFIVRGDL